MIQVIPGCMRTPIPVFNKKDTMRLQRLALLGRLIAHERLLAVRHALAHRRVAKLGLGAGHLGRIARVGSLRRLWGRRRGRGAPHLV